MDFLAYLSLKYPERLRIDATVLNSVVNLPKAVPFLSRHPVIHTFFDNDEAGRKGCKQIVEPSGAAPVAAVLKGKVDVKGKNVVCLGIPRQMQTSRHSIMHTCRTN